jgi:cobalamin-dependent methionine synthase I
MAQTQIESVQESGPGSVQKTIVITDWTPGDNILQQQIEYTLTQYGYDWINVRSPVEEILNHAHDQVAAIACLVQTVRERINVDEVMTFLRQRALNIPLILLGAGVDQQYAQALALPDNGDLYWAGVYLCDDESEMLQVLKQIIFYTPPPVTHEHEHEQESEDCASSLSCSSCAVGCPLSQG